MTFSLAGRTALVTGSSSGIGLGIGRAFQEAGARVLFHSHQPSPLED
jgi:NAD(P)-dependent dehydrogenase (short-subunit alcohol dehydrogenase family)